jgi:hypothetical protein
MKQPITTPTPSRRFNSGPRLHSAKAECDQVETKVWGQLAFICGLKRLARWLAVLLGLRRAEMKVVCAWCVPHRLLGTKECDWSQAGTETHSICPACRALHFPPEARPLFPTITAADWRRAMARADEETNPVQDQIRAEVRRRGYRQIMEESRQVYKEAAVMVEKMQGEGRAS